MRAKRVQRALRAPLPCFLPYTDVKTGMNVQLDTANGQRVFVQDLVCAARTFAREAFTVSFASNVTVFPALKIGINVQLDMVNGRRALLSGSCACSGHNCAQSVRRKLREHRYRVSCLNS